MQQVQQAVDEEDEVQFVDSGSETDSNEETDPESEIEIVMSDKEEDAGGDGIPPSVSTAEVQETTVASQVEMEVEATADVTEESAPKKQRTDTAPDDTLSGPSTAPESIPIIDPQPDPPTTDASKKTNLEEPYLYDFNFDFETTPSQPGSSSGGDAELKNDQIISLQQDAELKEVSSLQSQITNRDLVIDQLQGDVGMLMSIVYDLKAKLEKKFGYEFVDKEDEQFYVGRTEQTPEQSAVAHATAEAERASAVEAYLAAKPKKQSSKSKKRREEKEKEKQSKKQLLVMKNQDRNPLDENFQLKDPSQIPDRLVMELGSSHYDELGKKIRSSMLEV
ncbi:hypothetical protein Hanom_Chr17g01581551 [Helianthus anomalus]